VEEALKLFAELKGVFGGAVAIGVSAFVYLWSQRDKRAMSGADSAGQIKALDVYEELLKTEREARAASDQRADQFAKERNEAYQQVWELKGQMKQLTEELARVRSELDALKERFNAKP